MTLNKDREPEHLDTDPTPRDIWATVMSDIDGSTLDKVVERLKEQGHTDLSKVLIDQFDYPSYSDSNPRPYVRVQVLRKENEAETLHRVRVAKQVVDSQNARERAEFERLSAKFGGAK